MIEDQGVMEMSLNMNIHEVFPDRKYKLIIEVPKGTTCLFDMPYNSREDEMGVLFPVGIKLEVVKVEKIKFRHMQNVYCKMI